MKLVTFAYRNTILPGVLVDGGVVEIGFGSILELLETGNAGFEIAAEEVLDETPIPLADIQLLPPIFRPGKVLAIGKNYHAHAAEMDSVAPEFPMVFNKTHTSLIGDGQSITIPTSVEKPDYEGELVVVIGKKCHGVTSEFALDYVTGYMVGNDVSARGWQRRTSQFAMGKMVDTFGPVGPVMVTADEIADVQNLRVRTWLNGELMQDGNTKNMIFSVAHIISYISQVVTLEVGDMIFTGTPEGVGAGRKPPVWLSAGGEVVVEVEGIGRLTNPITSESE